jgi:hypothetical protein
MTGLAETIIEKIIAEGVKLLLREILNFIKTGMQYQAKWHLPASAILSDNILMNEKMPYEVKKLVADYKFNLRCIIAGIADQIEEEQYRNLDADIRKMELLPHERDKVTIIYDSQKKVSLSFQTLIVIVELFTKANDKIKHEIENRNNTANQSISLRLQNAVLVYELMNFVTAFVENFGLKGKAEITKIKHQVFADIESIEEKIKEKVVGKYNTVSDETRDSAIEDVANYKEILKSMKKRWDIIDKKVEDLENQVGEYKKILPDLEMYKSIAEIQIEILTLVAIMNIVEKNINLVKKLQHLKKVMLVSFTPQDYYELIGRQS